VATIDYTTAYLSEVAVLAAHLDAAVIDRMVEILEKVRTAQGRLFFLGVGGGAGNAGHAVTSGRLPDWNATPQPTTSRS